MYIGHFSDSIYLSILLDKLTFLCAVVVGPTLLLCHEIDITNQTNILQSNCKGFPL